MSIQIWHIKDKYQAWKEKKQALDKDNMVWVDKSVADQYNINFDTQKEAQKHIYIMLRKEMK